MDISDIAIQSQLEEASYGTSLISFLDPDCISFISRGREESNQSYYYIHGLGVKLFKDYPCLKL